MKQGGRIHCLRSQAKPRDLSVGQSCDEEKLIDRDAAAYSKLDDMGMVRFEDDGKCDELMREMNFCAE